MATGNLETITPAEFDKRLDASNARRQQELQQREGEQAQVEQLLTHYERTLDTLEMELDGNDALSSYSSPLRTRLQV